MLDIEKVDHVGIRVTDKATSIAFYEVIGFRLLTDVGFEHGHPVIMEHPSGVVVNLLGPANASPVHNILMDEDAKHPGITHVSYKVADMDEAKVFLAEKEIPLTGEISFKGLRAVFIRDPDRNVIKLDAYAGEEPGPRKDAEGYESHP